MAFTRRLAVFCVAGMTIGGLSPAFAVPVLSGLVVHNSSSNGSYDGVALSRWNTLGNETHTSNLYVIAGSDFNGTFINSGNGDAASISIPLALGDNTFSLLGREGFDAPYHTMNLFFGGANTTPLISVFGAAQTDATIPGFAATSSPNTYGLNAETLPGAGTLSFRQTASTSP